MKQTAMYINTIGVESQFYVGIFLSIVPIIPRNYACRGQEWKLYCANGVELLRYSVGMCRICCW